MYYNLAKLNKMKKLALKLISLFVLLWLTAAPVSAQTGPCASLQCPAGTSRSPLANGLCECVSGGANQAIFGTIEAPQGVSQYNLAADGGIGLIFFASNIIRVATVVAGVWVMINFILAGWKYITAAGDSKAPAEASQMMTNSLIGLAIIVGAYTLAAVIGLVFFGDAGYIINPQLRGA
jgi:hypothetical protein